jgi:hypothetical protein
VEETLEDVKDRFLFGQPPPYEKLVEVREEEKEKREEKREHMFLQFLSLSLSLSLFSHTLTYPLYTYLSLSLFSVSLSSGLQMAKNCQTQEDLDVCRDTIKE